MKIKFNWFGVTYFTKPFTSIGGFKSRWLYYFDIVRYKKHHEKKFGRWSEWFQDDEIHFFSIFPFVIMWGNMPDRNFVHENWQQPNRYSSDG